MRLTPDQGDKTRFLERIRAGMDPATAARADPKRQFTATMFRRAANRDPVFAAAYLEARRYRHELLWGARPSGSPAA